MCLAKVYIGERSEEEPFMQEIDFMKVGNKKILLRTIFGEKKEVAANLKEIDFANSIIIIEELRQQAK